MKILVSFLLSLLVSECLFSQVDPRTAPVVYHIAGMENVSVQKGLIYKTANDTTLKFDIYYPPHVDKTTTLPLVVFNNGVGSLELPGWRVYEDWARLAAVNGMIAVNHQSRHGRSVKDTEDLLDYLQQHAQELKLDKDRFALWACSGNVGAALPIAQQKDRPYIRALVMYYGAGWRTEDNVIIRQDLDIQLVRAGLDFYNLNRSIETLMKNALENDAHIEFVNYPEGQHAFDVFDDNDRSRAIIKQTLDFLKRKLSKDHPANDAFVLTNRKLWHMVMDEKQIDDALTEFRKAMQKYRGMSNHTPWYNHVIDERNLNQMGYQLLQENRVEDAIKVFTANQEAFPDSPNVYDGLGDAYEKSGNKEKAISNAKLALTKLDKAENLQRQAKQAIRESAEAKLKRLQ